MPAVPAGPWQRATLLQLWVWVHNGWCVRYGTVVWASGHRSWSWSLGLAAVQDLPLLRRPCQNMSEDKMKKKHVKKDVWFLHCEKMWNVKTPYNTLQPMAKCPDNLSLHQKIVWFYIVHTIITIIRIATIILIKIAICSNY